jgi:hypothetical protein
MAARAVRFNKMSSVAPATVIALRKTARTNTRAVGPAFEPKVHMLTHVFVLAIFRRAITVAGATLLILLKRTARAAIGSRHLHHTGLLFETGRVASERVCCGSMFLP